MLEPTPLNRLSSKVEELHRIADELYRGSEDFPAVNRNAKRVLAAVQMLRLALEVHEEEATY